MVSCGLSALIGRILDRGSLAAADSSRVVRGGLPDDAGSSGCRIALSERLLRVSMSLLGNGGLSSRGGPSALATDRGLWVICICPVVVTFAAEGNRSWLIRGGGGGTAMGGGGSVPRST
jgi:hypothetical protein